MRRRALLLALAAWASAAAGGAGPPGGPGLHRVAGNLIKNPSFEHDWCNRAFAQRRRFLLLQASDMGVGEADGLIDHWQCRRIPMPESWDSAVARSGSRSVRLEAPGQLTQLVRFAGEQFWKAGGAFYARYLPMEERLADQLPKRPIMVGAWCRTKDVPPGAEPQLVVTIDCAVRQAGESPRPTRQGRTRRTAAFSAGTHGWEYREVRVDHELDVEGDPERLKGTPFFLTVGLVSRGKGVVWFDDVSCVEAPQAGQPNLLANPGFESLRDGWPAAWSRPVLWTWFRNTYYSWTGWSHHERKTFRGRAQPDRMLAFTGAGSLRLTVFPGDNFAVASDPVRLGQDRPRPIEVRAMVKADNLRTLEIMAQDEAGKWLPQGDFLGDDMEEPGAYNFGSTGCGTYDWMCVRKYFSPRQPVRSLRIFLCVRGFDARIVERNLVGTVWLDDVEVFGHGAAKPQAERKPPRAPDLRVVDVDLGDRLWGRDIFQVTLSCTGRDAAARLRGISLRLTLTDPAGRARGFAGQTRIVRAPTAEDPAGMAVAAAPFVVDSLCTSWERQYRLSARLADGEGGELWPGAEFHFGTPSTLIEPGLSGTYLYPDETLVVYANLNVARGSFPDLARCEFILNGKKPVAALEDFSRILQPHKAPDYINTRNLAQVRLGSQGLAVHPWHEPTRDNAVVVRLHGRSGLLAETEPLRFGFMSPVPPARFPERIERTAVNERGLITVNGKVYFPVYWTPHFGICPEANYPPTRFGLKAVELTKIVCAKGQMPDAEVKAALLAKIAEVKDDPKLFQYELGEGEMQLQGDGWRERLAWCKRAIEWIREADPNHVINGPASWLVGHPRHNTAMQAFVPAWDVIGVEASFETVPEVARFARPRMAERRTAVLIGLETYFYQPSRVLRWRGYRGILNGAAGIGLCPSGMMQSRPDKVNFLRGLNGEFRGLAPVLAADPPDVKLTVSSDRVETMERVADGARTVIAVRGRDDGGPLDVRFGFPRSRRYRAVKVRFEGRSLAPDATGFQDRFAEVRTVHVYELRP